MSDHSVREQSSAERFRRQRHFARQCALQYLYQADLRHDWGNRKPNLAILKSQVGDVDEEVPTGGEFERAWAYAEVLVEGILSVREQLDERIGSCAANWTLSRMSVIDRNILRVAAYELLYRPEIPPLTTLDEGVELAKQFGHSDSRRFVNGVLDCLLRACRERGLIEAPADAERDESKESS